MIEVDNLSRRFRPNSLKTMLTRKRADEVVAVDGVTFHIDEGEIFGLVGPNGAGKTTLIKMLSTLLIPSGGTARINGHDVVKAGHPVRKMVGLVVSNERSFYWRLSGRQNMAFFADLYHLPKREANAWINELLDLLDLQEIADRRFDSYSTGMKQRLALARGLLSKPKIIFMDEPTKGVDPLAAAELVEIIKERVVDRWRATLLITSHNLREIERLCDRVAILNRGRLIAMGKIEELSAKVKGATTYDLKIRRLSRERINAMVARVAAAGPADISEDGDFVALKVQLEAGTDSLSDIIKAIVDDGGQIVDCSSIEKSFEDVFRALVENHSQDGSPEDS